MPEYVAIMICLLILAAAGSLKAPCAAAGLSMPRVWYMLLATAALSGFTGSLSVEISVNAGAAALTFLPLLLMAPGRSEGGAVGAVALFSGAIALLQRSGVLYGAQNGVLCGLMAGLSGMLLCGCPCCAAAAAVSIPVFTKIVDSFINMLLTGYTSLEICGDTLAAQLIALSISIAIIWVSSLTRGAQAKAE